MLEVQNLTKRYRAITVVDRVSFCIAPGDVLGYLGPNGAGKSTTVKMLTGLIDPSEGQIRFDGGDVHKDFAAFQNRMGYVPEEATLYPHLSGREYLQLAGRLRGIDHRVLRPKIDELLRLLDLWQDREAPAAAYSKGMRQKLLLAAAMLHGPDLLILDEPFSGLDVHASLVLHNLIVGFARAGKMVLFSSHVLEVVEKVCDRVVILRKGQVAAYDSVSRLRELMKQPSLVGVFAQLVEPYDSPEIARRILEVISV